MKPYIVSFFSSVDAFDEDEAGYELYRIMESLYKTEKRVWVLIDGRTELGKSVAAAVCSMIGFGAEDFMLFDCQEMMIKHSGIGNKVVDISDLVLVQVEKENEDMDPAVLYCRQQDKLYFNLCEKH